MEHISISMGEIIREMRRAKGLTQEALAQAMGISIQAVSKWETGQSLPDVTLLPAIADYFNITVDALFGREAQAQPEAAEGAAPAIFPDDNKLRVVQYLGSRLMSADECADGKEIRLMIDEARSQSDSVCKLEFEIQGSARISGPVHGALNVAKDAYVSGDVNGAANVQGDLTCSGNVNCSVRSNGTFTSRGMTTTIRMEAMNESLSGLKNSLSGLGNMVSNMFGNRRTGNAAGAHMNAFFCGELPDDDVIRIVQMQGRRIMSAEESRGQKVIRLSVEHITDPLNVEVYGSAQIEGDINGNATAGDAMACGRISGNASAGDSLTCGDVSGNASAGDGVRCGNVGGSVRAGDSAHITGDVGGSVTASDSVTCAVVHGNVRAGDSVKYTGSKRAGSAEAKYEKAASMPDMRGFADGALHIVQVMNGEILSVSEAQKGEAICLELEDADGITVHIHGNAQIEGDIEGDVRADGSVTCGSVEGDVHARAQVSCGSVEGDVHAGAQVNCETVEGDVSAGAQVNCETVEGDVTAGASVTCGSVEGNVSVQGESDKCSVTCEGVEGDVTALNASVRCAGAIGGSVDIRCDEPNPCTVSCESVEGDVTALNAAVDCREGVIGGDVDARSDQADKCIVICAGVEGDVTLLNAAVNCRDGVIGGDVDARSDRADKCVIICEGVEGSVTARSASVNCAGVVGGDIDAEGETDEE